MSAALARLHRVSAPANPRQPGQRGRQRVDCKQQSGRIDGGGDGDAVDLEDRRRRPLADADAIRQQCKERECRGRCCMPSLLDQMVAQIGPAGTLRRASGRSRHLATSHPVAQYVLLGERG